VGAGPIVAGMHVSGKGMAQPVRQDPIWVGQRYRDSALLDLKQRRLACQGLRAVPDRVEQPGGGCSAGMGASQCLLSGNGLNHPLVQEHEVLLVALATLRQHAGTGRHGIGEQDSASLNPR
jgi:hypothetical protein